MAENERTLYGKIAEVVINDDYKKMERAEILKICEDINCDYAFVYHDKDILSDGTPKIPHWHIHVRFKDTKPFTTIANYFSVSVNNVNRIKKWSSAITYLSHRNAPAKHQYEFSEITSNFDFTSIIEKYETKKSIDNILKQIDSGQIKRHNLVEYIDIKTYATYKTKIENALKYQEYKMTMNKDREISVIFLQGLQGTGKTVFAKEYCKTQNLSYCISSCSNDVMQDYRGEDVLILDDLRDSDFKFTDLLKILDNHTSSSMLSRYNNKHFLGSTIIITSFDNLSDWYKNVPFESRQQLYRRINQLYSFSKKTIEFYTYDKKFLAYKLVGIAENTFAKKYDYIEKTENLLNKMGLELKKPDIETPFDNDNKTPANTQLYIDEIGQYKQ